MLRLRGAPGERDGVNEVNDHDEDDTGYDEDLNLALQKGVVSSMHEDQEVVNP